MTDDETKELMTLSEALEFAKEYLETRRLDINQYSQQDDYYREQGYVLAMGYIINDIIPHIYGEALD